VRALPAILLAAVALGLAGDWAIAVLPSGTELTLEIAADDRSRARGYMFRERIGADEGMLLVFDQSGRHGIWMKNCLVPLDIIWLDEQHRIVEIASDRQPCPAEGPCPSAVPLKSARYVLEVVAGTAAREKLQPGASIHIISE
jgi:uncharacterized membrane protein (UPF0127 family)